MKYCKKNGEQKFCVFHFFWKHCSQFTNIFADPDCLSLNTKSRPGKVFLNSPMSPELSERSWLIISSYAHYHLGSSRTTVLPIQSKRHVCRNTERLFSAKSLRQRAVNRSRMIYWVACSSAPMGHGISTEEVVLLPNEDACFLWRHFFVPSF